MVGSSQVPVEQLIEDGRSGKCQVCLWVKGWRPMYDPKGPSNFFSFGQGAVHLQTATVAEVCERLGIDPQFVHDLYFYYRFQERHLPQEESERAWDEILKLVTNLFPFPSLKWMREMPKQEGNFVLGDFRPQVTKLRREELEGQIQAGEVAHEAWLKRIRVVCG